MDPIENLFYISFKREYESKISSIKELDDKYNYLSNELDTCSIDTTDIIDSRFTYIDFEDLRTEAVYNILVELRKHDERYSIYKPKKKPNIHKKFKRKHKKR